MTRLLLTGAGGFVGHHVLEHVLLNTDWDVVGTDSFRHRGVTDRITDVLDRDPSWPERVTVLRHDLAAPFSEVALERLGAVDYVINMASESHVDRSIADPATFVANNVALILNVLEACRRLRPKAIVQVSTDEVYGPALAGYEHREWDTIAPSNPYAASKAAQEAICFAYWRTYDLPVLITNTMNIIGERQDPEKFLQMLIRRILRGQQVDIHAGTDGTPGSRFYLHARNQADALLFLLRQDRRKSLLYSDGAERPLRFNVVGEREVDNLQLARMVAERVGADLKHRLVDFHTSRPGHDLRYALDGSRMAELGWKPPVIFEDSLIRTVDWTLAHPEWM